MSNAQILSFEAARKIRQVEQADLAYQAILVSMDKLELLEEMIRFQEQRSRVGRLTLEMMVRGKLLFKALESNAETRELQLLTRSYRRHLEHELAAYLSNSATAEEEAEEEL